MVTGGIPPQLRTRSRLLGNERSLEFIGADIFAKVGIRDRLSPILSSSVRGAFFDELLRLRNRVVRLPPKGKH